KGAHDAKGRLSSMEPLLEGVLAHGWPSILRPAEGAVPHDAREEDAMKRPSIIAMGLLLIGLTVLGGAYVGFAQSGGGWVTLIDGATGLDNWNRVGDANWRAENGPIVAATGNALFPVAH